jgi:hypothetical protein
LKSEYPALASLAAQLEMFGLPKRDLDVKFTKSEMYVLAWRSQEISAGLQKDMERTSPGGVASGRWRQQDDSIPEGLPDEYFNEEGELDLSKVTGEKAWRYLNRQGVRLPVFSR